MVFGTLERAYLAHYNLQNRRRRWLRSCCCHAQSGRPLRSHGDFHHRYVRGEQLDSRVVRQRMWSDKGEEVECHWDRHNSHECKLYL